MRTDENNNPTAFTVDLAVQAGLRVGVDYVSGKPFPPPSRLVTARITGDPVEVTIRLIDVIGFYTSHGSQRWIYIAMPQAIWKALRFEQKRAVIGFMYRREGGTALKHLFPEQIT